MSEVKEKIGKIQELLRKENAGAIRLKGVDWFSWATGGGDSHVIFSNETGVADVVVTPDRAMIVTSPIEKERLALEQVPSEYEIVSFPWADVEAPEKFIKGLGSRILSDRPIKGEEAVPESLKRMKATLTEAEIVRYRALGADAAKAATEALSQVRPEMTEWELAGLAAKALWSRGIHPLLTLVGSEKRVLAHRHPVASKDRLGQHAMLVICGRRHGLFANLTRHVYFRDLTNEEIKLSKDVAEVEAEAFRATEELLPLSGIYQRLSAKYAAVGHAQDIEKHHQGGPTGYLSRESIAHPTNAWKTGRMQAFAWNPSLPGAKIEDTVFLNQNGKIEVLTIDPTWPTFSFDGRARPDVLIRK